MTNEELYTLVEEAFLLGVQYQLQKENVVVSSTMPNDINGAIDYAKKFLVDKDRDKECLSCKRYLSKSCKGTINRGRTTINKHNQCAAYSKGDNV